MHAQGMEERDDDKKHAKSATYPRSCRPNCARPLYISQKIAPAAVTRHSARSASTVFALMSSSHIPALVNPCKRFTAYPLALRSAYIIARSPHMSRASADGSMKSSPRTSAVATIPWSVPCTMYPICDSFRASSSAASWRRTRSAPVRVKSPVTPKRSESSNFRVSVDMMDGAISGYPSSSHDSAEDPSGARTYAVRWLAGWRASATVRMTVTPYFSATD